MEFTCVTQVTCTYGKFRVRVSGACIYALAHVVYAGVFFCRMLLASSSALIGWTVA